MRRTTTIILVLLTIGAIASPAALGQEAIGCDAVVPDRPWDQTIDLGPVLFRSSGLPEARAERFARSFAEAATVIDEEIGGLKGVEICVFDDLIPVDAQALGWPEGQSLRAVSLGPARAVLLSSWNIGLVEPAGYLGLVHQAQFGLADGAYPEPLGGAVRSWYRARFSGRLDTDHSTMRYANLVRSIPEAIPWTAGSIEPTMLWNPQFQNSAIGDFVEYVVATAGVEALRDPGSVDFIALQDGWQRELLIEARGSERPTTGWITGLIILAVIALVAGVLFAIGFSQRTRMRRQRDGMKTLPIEGSEAESVSSGAGGDGPGLP